MLWLPGVPAAQGTPPNTATKGTLQIERENPIQPTLTADTVIQNAEFAYSPPVPKPSCTPQEGDEIIVCAIEQEQSQFRVKSSNALDVTSEEALDDGLPRAPDFAPPPCKPNLLTVCPKIGGAPEPVLIVDLTKLPEIPIEPVGATPAPPVEAQQQKPIS